MTVNLKRWARLVLAHSAERFGYRLVSEKPLDLTGGPTDPLAAAYIARGRQFVCQVPTTQCRALGMMGLPLGPDSCHPFSVTAREILQYTVTNYVDSALAAYYTRVRPHSAAEVLGVSSPEPAKLQGLTAAQTILPWQSIHPEAMAEVRLGTEIAENKDSDVRDPAEYGWREWGPVPEFQGRSEWQRISRLCDSIGRSGYKRSDRPDGDIGGIVLTHGEKRTILITMGQHRAAVLAALDWPTLPIRVQPSSTMAQFIRREDAPQWPAVLAGYFSENDALKVFDRLLEGSIPDVAKDWAASSETV